VTQEITQLRHWMLDYEDRESLNNIDPTHSRCVMITIGFEETLINKFLYRFLSEISFNILVSIFSTDLYVTLYGNVQLSNFRERQRNVHIQDTYHSCHVSFGEYSRGLVTVLRNSPIRHMLTLRKEGEKKKKERGEKREPKV